LQLTVPYYSGRIVDLFLSGADARENMRTNSGLFYHLLILMIVFTVLRGVIVYGDCMIYEHVSQTVLYRVRNFLYDKIQRQDMTFYSTYRTGDLMTRVTGDLDAVRHMVAWVIRMVIESFSLFGVVAIYFFYMNWKMALSLLIISPFVFFIIYLFKNKVAPMHAKLREKLAQMNTYAQENISGNRVVKAFAREAYEIEKFDRANKDYAETNKETSMVWLKFFPYVESIANLMPVVMLAVGGVFLTTNPVLTFFMPAGGGLLAGPIYLLLIAKVHKRWSLSIMGVIMGIIWFVTGMHWAFALGYMIMAIVADFVAGAGQYKSKKLNSLQPSRPPHPPPPPPPPPAAR